MASLAFDHVHLISKTPHETARWYVEKLGAVVTKDEPRHGAPQIYLAFGDASVIVRGERANERPGAKSGFEWGVDHFGFRVREDFDGFCASLKAKGVAFSMEPTQINPATKIAFIQAPDGVSIELLARMG